MASSLGPQKTLITGAAGFIGSALVRALAKEQGSANNLILCDLKTHFAERSDLYSTQLLSQPFADGTSPRDFAIIDRDHLMSWLKTPAARDIGMIYHIGACSSTLQLDEKILDQLNFKFSQDLWRFAVQAQVPFYYASSGATYGLGILNQARQVNPSPLSFDDSPEVLSQLRPINPYGWSKHRFDLWTVARAREQSLQTPGTPPSAALTPPRWAGFKFFNVYGYGEAHKGIGASMVFHWTQQILKTGQAKLFKSYRRDYQDGQQMRDFIFIGDVVQTLQAVNTRSLQNGVYNLGSGKAHTWIELAHSIFSALGKSPKIEWLEMPVELRERYQYFTQAKMDRLQAQGFMLAPTPLQDGVRESVEFIGRSRHSNG